MPRGTDSGDGGQKYQRMADEADFSKEEEGAMQRAGGYMSLGGRRGHFLPELSVEEHGVWYYI